MRRDGERYRKVKEKERDSEGKDGLGREWKDRRKKDLT